MTAPAVPRPASTVVVVRPAAPGIEVLLVRRSDAVAFMAGACVFPGGRVDEADHTAPGNRPWLHGVSRFPDLTPLDEWPYRVAAVRELAEEAGVTIDMDALVPLAHWVTPEVEIRRYDTRFFLARMPDVQEARHDAGETTAVEWVAPSDAIARCLRREIMLPPPTWTTLRELERFASVEAAIDWASRRRIVRVQPGFLKTNRGSVLTLPGDPSHPAIDGWEIPAETRFVLEEGRGWLPVIS